LRFALALKLIKKFLTWFGFVIVAGLILMVCFVMISSQYGWHFNTVLSGSMEPAFKIGGLVITRPVSAPDLKPGDAITFKLKGLKTPICHRIISLQSLDGQVYLQTQGDANPAPDSDLVPLSSVQGKVILHIPAAGRLIELKNSGSVNLGFLNRSLPITLLCVFILGMLLALLTLKDIFEQIFNPSKQIRADFLKKQKERMFQRKTFFRIR
jgi:signal peptidase I